MRPGLIVAMASEFEALRRAGVEGVVKSGIGKVEAARTATEMILRDRPDCIINSGCAGGLSAGVRCDLIPKISVVKTFVSCSPKAIPLVHGKSPCIRFA